MPPSVVSTDSVVSIMLPASPPSHARQVRPGSTCTVDRTDSCGGPHRVGRTGVVPSRRGPGTPRRRRRL